MRKSLSRNHYFIIGLCLGLFISFYIPEDIWECPQEIAENNLIEKFGLDFEPHLNLINKPLSAKKPVKNVVRPRYYSSELGIREKFFIGVMTSQENINTLATAINRTTAHLVNKIKFFINADNVKTNYKLNNIVGFTDTRENLRPFHIIKYIADHYLVDYDYFFIIPDTLYVDARKLKSMLFHMSIAFDVYMGSRLDSTAYYDNNVAGKSSASASNNNNNNDDFQTMNDRNYCDLDAGILLSASVIQKMRNNLDWCVRNGNSNLHSINIGRCVKYSSKLNGCLESFQGIKQQVFQLKEDTKIFKDLSVLSKDQRFLNASTVFPVQSTDDFYRLHAFFSKYHLELVQQKNDKLERKSYGIANGSITNNILEIRWPLGLPSASIPETRHDIIMWHLINGTHIFLPNADNVVEPLNHVDVADVEMVLDSAKRYAAKKYPKLQFVNIHTIYRRFDATRGMDYQLHLNFYETEKSETIVKSFEIIKPLGRVEVVPSPYVTESTRISMLVPAFEHQTQEAYEFINNYERICMKNQDNTFLLMIFLYRYNSESKGNTDPFKEVKTLALELSTKYKLDGSRIAWVSIRLPPSLSDPVLPDELMLSSLYGKYEILSIAVADLALPKIGLDSLVLMGSSSVIFKTDFLNRVRMNTIKGFQVYSPIGFMMYPCKFANLCKECPGLACDVSQGSGYFDRWNFDIISFYSRDYVQARKMLEHSLPITRNDNDIEQLLTQSTKKVHNILDMFAVSQLRIHLLRGVEPNLRFGNAIRNYVENNAKQIPQCPARYDTDLNQKENFDSDANADKQNEIPNRYISSRNEDLNLFNTERKCLQLASRKQLGDAIIRYEDKSILQK